MSILKRTTTWPAVTVATMTVVAAAPHFDSSQLSTRSSDGWV
ncbi:hypothetical protein [Actinomadura nitritigenes]